MAKYTIYYRGSIMGSYVGANEKEALDVLAKEQGFPNSAAALAKLGLQLGREVNGLEDVKVKAVLDE